MGIEADRPQKWLSVKNRIAEKDGIQVNFSDKHNFYLSAYRYVCKSDQEVAHSENHLPGLLTAASEFRATCATKRKSTEGESSVVLQKSEKFDQPGFRKVHSRKSLLLLRGGELLFRWTLLNSYSNEVKKYSVNFLPQFGKWSQPKKN